MINAHIAERRSPRAFDPHHVLGEQAIATLLEAARWAPSAMNRQPWRFLVGYRGDVVFKGLADALSGNNQLWAPSAGALIAVLLDNGDPEAATDPVRAYEVGLAMGQLGIQAQSMGLITHQMGGFDAAHLRREFDLAPQLRPLVVLAVGESGDPDALPQGLRERESATRERTPVHGLMVRPAERSVNMRG